MGKEAEHPVVDDQGRAVDLASLWPDLLGTDLTAKYDDASQKMIVGLAGADYSFAQEVGRGTIEINTRPCQTLHEVDACYRAALARLLPALADRNWSLLGYGIQPVTPPSLALLAPKSRYRAMHRAMGDDWLWYTVTASDQTQVSIGRHEMITQLNTLHMLTPVIVALCANSPVAGNRLSPYLSAREGHPQAGAYGDRHGMPAAPYKNLTDFAAQLAAYPMLLKRQGDILVPAGKPFLYYLAADGADFDDFLLHEHYIWHSARLRHAYGTIEVRPACQQPFGEHMAASALILGLVASASRQADLLSDRLGPEGWSLMRGYYKESVTRGLEAAEPVAGLLEGVLSLAEQALIDRGVGEEIYVAPLWRRLAQKENPARQIAQIYRTGGLHQFLDSAAISSAVLSEYCPD